MPFITQGGFITHSSQINPGVIEENDLATGAVSTRTILDGDVKPVDLASGRITETAINLFEVAPRNITSDIYTLLVIDTHEVNVPAAPAGTTLKARLQISYRGTPGNARHGIAKLQNFTLGSFVVGSETTDYGASTDYVNTFSSTFDLVNGDLYRVYVINTGAAGQTVNWFNPVLIIYYE